MYPLNVTDFNQRRGFILNYVDFILNHVDFECFDHVYKENVWYSR